MASTAKPSGMKKRPGGAWGGSLDTCDGTMHGYIGHRLTDEREGDKEARKQLLKDFLVFPRVRHEVVALRDARAELPEAAELLSLDILGLREVGLLPDLKLEDAAEWHRAHLVLVDELQLEVTVRPLRHLLAPRIDRFFLVLLWRGAQEETVRIAVAAR
eukprot:scaffold73122_cov61-Phaeocystis_antarctica.AAC.2